MQRSDTSYIELNISLQKLPDLKNDPRKDIPKLIWSVPEALHSHPIITAQERPLITLKKSPKIRDFTEHDYIAPLTSHPYTSPNGMTHKVYTKAKKNAVKKRHAKISMVIFTLLVSVLL